jgi:hypothetical protein
VPEVPTPPIAEWLAIASFPSWLEELCVRDAESESRLRRAIAAANVARLWFFTERLTDAATIQRLTDRPRTPADAAREWIAGVDIVCVTAIERWALDRTRVLVEDFPPDSRDDALRWLHLRDDLASLVEVLRPRARDALAHMLAGVDDQVADDPVWATFSPFDDPRLQAVGTQDPAAWWSAPAYVVA